MSDSPLIAIVDDDESLRTAMTGLVRSIGMRACGFGSAEELLGCGDDFQCVISDVHMPGMSGIELTTQLQQRAIPVPVIVISARPEQDLKDRALAAGAITMLNKPFDADELISCLEAAVAK